MNEKLIGFIAALVIGVIFVWLGALNAFFVGLIMLGGWLIGKFFAGEIDILELYERFMQSKGKRPRR